MLIPWRIESRRDRDRAAAAFPEFKGRLLVPSGLSEPDADTLRHGVVDRLRAETDPDRDLWITAGRAEHPKSMYSLLHATLDGAEEATVDLLVALPGPEKDDQRAYGGYGELALLALLLERQNVRRLRIPLTLDGTRTGLASAGWRPGPGGLYVHAGGSA